MKGLGNLLFQSVKRPKMANRCNLWLWKKRTLSGFAGYIHILKTVHLQQFKWMKSSKLGMWKGDHLSRYKKWYLRHIKESGAVPLGGASLYKFSLSTLWDFTYQFRKLYFERRFSPRKQPTFRATLPLVSPPNDAGLRNERRNSILMTRH